MEICRLEKKENRFSSSFPLSGWERSWEKNKNRERERKKNRWRRNELEGKEKFSEERNYWNGKRKKKKKGYDRIIDWYRLARGESIANLSSSGVVIKQVSNTTFCQWCRFVPSSARPSNQSAHPALRLINTSTNSSRFPVVY